MALRSGIFHIYQWDLQTFQNKQRLLLEWSEVHHCWKGKPSKGKPEKAWMQSFSQQNYLRTRKNKWKQNKISTWKEILMASIHWEHLKSTESHKHKQFTSFTNGKECSIGQNVDICQVKHLLSSVHHQSGIKLFWKCYSSRFFIFFYK